MVTTSTGTSLPLMRNSYVHSGVGEGNEAAPPALQCGGLTLSCSPLTTVESLEPADYQCGDRVIFFTKVRVDSEAVGSQSIDINYVFDAAPTGQPGVGYSDIIQVGISNEGVFAPTQASEPASINLDGDETATLISEAFSPGGSTFGVDAQELLGTVRVTNLNASDQLVVRIDVRLDCYAGNPTGNLTRVHRPRRR